MPSFRHLFAFFCASLMLSGLVYRDAMWGGSLLAPLDIGPYLFEHYEYMDPYADGIPKNHHIIDQFTYDLPLQQTIHRSYRNHEIPWWDPHTYGGRPLLADAHVNGTDPIRLVCYYLLPFELAYNWNIILRGVITGLGMFLLLARLGVKATVAAPLALAYQFAGWFTLFFGHPWIQGSFVWFPFVWMAWFGVNRGNMALRSVLGGVACALIFYAGNLQSHTYLPLFAMTLLIAVLVKCRVNFVPTLGVCILSGVIGALLAFPVLANQAEFYLLGVRPVTVGEGFFGRAMSAPVALTGFYPWVFGSFKTLDAGRLIGAGGVAYTLFFGTTAFLMALVGAFGLRRQNGELGLVTCHSIILVTLYLIIISTPLESLFYSRSAALGGMALTVLAGVGTQGLLLGSLDVSRKIAQCALLTVVMMALGSSALVWLAYPRFIPAIEKKILQPGADEQTSMFVFSNLTEIRKAQIQRFPSEVSILNPQAALSVAATLILCAALLVPRSSSVRSGLIVSSLCIGLLPVVLFHHRFRPKHPVALWQSMLEGGPAQKMAIDMAQGGLRIDETRVPVPGQIFPYATAALYQVHVIHGYSALQPKSIFRHPADEAAISEEWRADLIHVANGEAQPQLVPALPYPSRFRCEIDGSPASVRIVEESQNTIILSSSSGEGTQGIIRTDTQYPGWTLSSGGSINPLEPCFSALRPVANKPGSLIRILYRPALQYFYLPSIIIGLGGIITLMFAHLLHHASGNKQAL